MSTGEKPVAVHKHEMDNPTVPKVTKPKITNRKFSLIFLMHCIHWTKVCESFISQAENLQSYNCRTPPNLNATNYKFTVCPWSIVSAHSILSFYRILHPFPLKIVINVWNIWICCDNAFYDSNKIEIVSKPIVLYTKKKIKFITNTTANFHFYDTLE